MNLKCLFSPNKHCHRFYYWYHLLSLQVRNNQKALSQNLLIAESVRFISWKSMNSATGQKVYRCLYNLIGLLYAVTDTLPTHACLHNTLHPW